MKTTAKKNSLESGKKMDHPVYQQKEDHENYRSSSCRPCELGHLQ